MSDAKNQYQRVARAFTKVLDNRNRDPVEYEDDAWNFFLNCWHLKDWIKNDFEGVAKATREKIDVEVHSYPSLAMVGNLVNKSKQLRVTRGSTEADIKRRRQGTLSGTAYIDGKVENRQADKGRQEVILLVVNKKGDEIPVRKLATDAMKNWMAIIKKYRI
jgi:hypothetical protein